MDHWSRRQFVQGVGVAGLGLLAGCGRLPGQGQKTVLRIGVLLPYGIDDQSSQELLQPLRDGLHEWGYVEGRNISLDVRYSAGQDDRLPELAAELIRLPVDLLVTE